MAIRVIEEKECDTHGAKCTKKETVETRRFYSILTGKPWAKEMCEPAWAAHEKHDTELLKDAREEVLKVASSGGNSQQSEEAALWAPLINRAKEWHKETFGEVPRGRLTLKSEKVQQFLKAPVNAAWKDWEPGQHIPA